MPKMVKSTRRQTIRDNRSSSRALNEVVKLVQPEVEAEEMVLDEPSDRQLELQRCRSIAIRRTDECESGFKTLNSLYKSLGNYITWVDSAITKAVAVFSRDKFKDFECLPEGSIFDKIYYKTIFDLMGVIIYFRAVTQIYNYTVYY